MYSVDNILQCIAYILHICCFFLFDVSPSIHSNKLILFDLLLWQNEHATFLRKIFCFGYAVIAYMNKKRVLYSWCFLLLLLLACSSCSFVRFTPSVSAHLCTLFYFHDNKPIYPSLFVPHFSIIRTVVFIWYHVNKMRVELLQQWILHKKSRSIHRTTMKWLKRCTIPNKHKQHCKKHTIYIIIINEQEKPEKITMQKCVCVCALAQCCVNWYAPATSESTFLQKNYY